MAQALRQYVSGHIHNDELDSVEVDWRDRGAVYIQEMAWHLYDDMYRHYAKGRHYLDKTIRKEISRWIVFLHSDNEYLWPEYSFIQIVNWPMNLLTLGWRERKKKKKWEQFLEAGDFQVWPFCSKKELQKAISRPRLLVKSMDQAAQERER